MHWIISIWMLPYRVIKRYRVKGNRHLVVSLIKYELQNNISKTRYLAKPLPDYISLHNLQHPAKSMCNLPPSTESLLGQHITVLPHSCHSWHIDGLYAQRYENLQFLQATSESVLLLFVFLLPACQKTPLWYLIKKYFLFEARNVIMSLNKSFHSVIYSLV